MIKLASRIILLLVIQVALVHFFWAQAPLSSPVWGDEVGNLKYNSYFSSSEQYSSIFIGSSRFYRHISPSLFDSIQRDQQSKSYNWGAPAFNGHKTLFLLRNILSRNKLPKNIFVEFDFGNMPNGDNLHQGRTFYPYDFFIGKTLIQSILTSNIGIFKKAHFLIIHCINFTDNLFKVGLGVDLIKSAFFHLPIGKCAHLSDLGELRDGYYPLDQQLSDNPNNLEMQNRSIQIKDYPQKLTNKKHASQSGFRKGRKQDSNEKFLTELFYALINQAKSKGVQLIFVLSPRRGDEYQFLLPVFDNLPPGNKIELADPDKFPEFYSPDNSFDAGHLNNKGAILFTKALCKHFETLQNNLVVPEKP